MFKTSLLYTFLILCILSLHPLTAVGAPQHTDINKPTRERVNKNNKKDDNKKASKDAAAKKEEDNKKAASTDKNKNTAAKPADNKSTADKNAAAKPAEKNVEKPVEKKDDKVKDANAPANDTAKKAAPAAPKKVPQDPNVVQFDGIDVSKHQGYINWAELKKYTKIKFVYIKATEGADYIDPRYQENIRNAKKHGFKVGSYHFLSTKSSAVKQFQNFIKTAKREEQDLLPVIDVERLKPWSAQQLRDSLKVFADLLEDYYGCKPLIYTSEKFFTSNLGRAFANYPLFIAKYSSAAPNINYPWIMWQFSDCGIFKSAVKENRGEVDMSRFNKGHSINDIIYTPSKHKPKSSVKDAVDHKEKPASVNLTEQKPKETPKMSKRQQEEAQKQAEKDKKAKERNKKLAEEEAKKKAEEAKKAKEKEERLKKEKARQQAREEAAKKEAEEKAKRKAAAQKAREEKKANSQTSKKATTLMQTNASKLSQTQRNDSIRAANSKGRKTNKSSADND